MIKELESEIQNTICEYLSLKKYFFWRQNNVPISMIRDGQRTFRRMPKYSKAGIPDIIVINNGGIVTFLEVKRKGGKLSDVQIEFKKECDYRGINYFVVYSLDDVKLTGL